MSTRNQLTSIPVFYSSNMVVKDNISDSPSAGKPAEVMASWKNKESKIVMYSPNPIKREDFYLAHDSDHVDAVLDCKAFNGFDNKLPSVAASLPWTTGSMLTAAKHTLKHNILVSVSPTSGFHHATYTQCNGFCTFNGLMVTAIWLKQHNLVNKVGILDIDEHYGDGTDDIIQTLGIDYIHHYTFGSDNFKKGTGDVWLNQRLPKILEQFAGCEIVLYQAGADPHTDDPYGRGLLTTEQLYRRDMIVFKALKEMDIPVVWNLAGGYQTPLRKVLDIHDNTMKACEDTYLSPNPTDKEKN